MKTERRHELEKNQLADWLTSKITWCEENARLIAGVVAGIAIIGIVYFVLSNRKQEREASAWNAFFTASVGPNTGALETLAKNDGDLLAGQLADLRLADHYLSEGINEMSKDRAAATEKITKSKDYYSRLEKSRNVWLQERAALGLARGYETLAMLDKAQEHYAKLRDFKGGLYHDLAVDKLEYLSRDSTQKFAEWYKNHKPRTPAGAGARPLVDPSKFTMPNDATHSGLNLSPDTIFPAGTGAATTPSAPAASATGDASRYAVPAATPSGSAAATPAATPTTSAAPAAPTPAATSPAASTTPTATKPAASPSASASATPAATPK